MKKVMQAAVVFILLSFTIKEEILGRWETKPSEKGTVTGVVFKADKTLEGYVNKKPFTTGRYEFANNTLSFTDNGCNGAKGIYRVEFFSNGDSIRFAAIDDSCTERKTGITKLIMGRVK